MRQPSGDAEIDSGFWPRLFGFEYVNVRQPDFRDCPPRLQQVILQRDAAKWHGLVYSDQPSVRLFGHKFGDMITTDLKPASYGAHNP